MFSRAFLLLLSLYTGDHRYGTLRVPKQLLETSRGNTPYLLKAAFETQCFKLFVYYSLLFWCSLSKEDYNEIVGRKENSWGL